MKPMNSQTPMSPSHGFPFGTVTLVFLVLLILGGGYWVYTSPMISESMKDDGKMQMMDDKNMMKDDMMMKHDEKMMGTGEWTKEEMKAMEKDYMMMTGSDMKNDMMMKKDTMMDDQKMMDDSMMKKDESAITKPTGYIAYDATKVTEALKAGQKVVFFFHATWCPSCRALDKAITADTVPADTLIVKVDYDTSESLKKQYRVTSQHTTVLLNADGTEKSKKIGSRNLMEVLN